MVDNRLPHEKGFHVSWDQIHRDSRALAWRLDKHGPMEGGTWKAVVAITRGGMAPAMIVARELDIRTVDTISVKSYHSGGGKADERRTAEVLKSPDPEIMGDGEGILIIDDLVDTGKTLELVRSLYPKAHVATVYAKPQGRAQVQTFITEVSQDTWIFFPWDMALQYVQPYRGQE
nr:xanthine phosphoribosyltransferase [Oceanicola sp. S124]